MRLAQSIVPFVKYTENPRLRGLAVLLLLIATIPQLCLAQSTIFNIPSTDTVSKGKFYFEFDYLPQVPKASGSDRLNIYVPRGVVGIGPNLEAGANVAFLNQGGNTHAFFQPNVKWKFYNDEKSGVAASGGGILYTPINYRDGVNTFGLLYVNISEKVKHAYGPRFTEGFYGIAGVSDDEFAGPRAGALLGYEQPIHPKVSIVADWFSGKNSFGYFTPGVSFTLPKNGLLNIGYSLGNDSYDGNHNRALFVYYGQTF